MPASLRGQAQNPNGPNVNSAVNSMEFTVTSRNSELMRGESSRTPSVALRANWNRMSFVREREEQGTAQDKNCGEQLLLQTMFNKTFRVKIQIVLLNGALEN